MKNSWWIIAAPVAIVAVIGLSIFDQVHYAQRKGYAVSCTHQSEPSGATESLVCVSNNHQEYDDGKPYPPSRDVFLAWPEGITAILLAFTLGAIGWQSYETRRAANAQVDGNRAWIFADLEKLGIGCHGQFTKENGEPATHLLLRLNFSNEGHSPAWVDSIQGHMEILPRKQKPPKSVDFMSFPYRFTIKVGAKEIMNPDFDCVGHLTNATDDLFIWIVIRYHDGHGIKGETSLGYGMNPSGTLFRQNNIPERNYNK